MAGCNLARVVLPAASAILAGGVCLLACSRERPPVDPVVLRSDGEVTRLSEIRASYEAAAGAGSFGTATREEKLTHVRRLADRAVLLREAAARISVPSRRTQVQLVRYRERFLVDALLEDLQRRGARGDSLLHVAQLDLRAPALEPLRRVFVAFWDSLNHRQIERGDVPYLSLDPPPIDAFAPEERSLVLMTSSRGSMTIEEFVQSLRSCDLEFWPTVARTATQIEVQVRRRLVRWLAEGIAREQGLDHDPRVRDRLAAEEENLLLRDFRELVAESEVATTESTIDSVYRLRRDLAPGRPISRERARAAIRYQLTEEGIDRWIEARMPEWRRRHRVEIVEDALLGLP